MLETKNGRLMLSSKFALYSGKKLRFIKEQEQETKRSLSNLGLKTPLNKTPLLGIIFIGRS